MCLKNEHASEPLHNHPKAPGALLPGLPHSHCSKRFNSFLFGSTAGVGQTPTLLSLSLFSQQPHSRRREKIDRLRVGWLDGGMVPRVQVCPTPFFFLIAIKPRVQGYTESLSLTYEPVSEPLHTLAVEPRVIG